MSVQMVMINGRAVAIEQSQIPTNVRSSDRFVGLHPRPSLFVLRQDWSGYLVPLTGPDAIRGNGRFANLASPASDRFP